MSCNCGATLGSLCGDVLQPAPSCADLGGSSNCQEIFSTDCIIYTGPDLPCYGITTNMTLTEILEIIYQGVYPNCVTTTTTIP